MNRQRHTTLPILPVFIPFRDKRNNYQCFFAFLIQILLSILQCLIQILLGSFAN